ncbi:retrovirus-related Pol polyprotein from transposon 17.6 [Trichonephila clavipes]|nr:retrovirus-related Pol polyprotein from transposon 17.6 [Trichonephila clavipes]
MNWPAYSPDLNPIEHVWDMLGRRIAARQPPPTCLLDLRRAFLDEWCYNFLPVEILNAVQTRSQVKAAREERGEDSGDAKKGEDEAIIVSSDAEDEILIPALQEYDQDASSKWDKHLPSILLALRTVFHESTGYTPSELVYGKNLRTPETLVMEHWMEPEEESDLVTAYMFKLINRLKRCQEVAINKMEEMQVKRKTWYDKNAVKREFKDWDLVLVLATSRANKLAV